MATKKREAAACVHPTTPFRARQELLAVRIEFKTEVSPLRLTGVCRTCAEVVEVRLAANFGRLLDRLLELNQPAGVIGELDEIYGIYDNDGRVE